MTGRKEDPLKLWRVRLHSLHLPYLWLKPRERNYVEKYARPGRLATRFSFDPLALGGKGYRYSYWHIGADLNGLPAYVMSDGYRESHAVAVRYRCWFCTPAVRGPVTVRKISGGTRSPQRSDSTLTIYLPCSVRSGYNGSDAY